MTDPAPVVWMSGGVRTEIQLTGQDTAGAFTLLLDEPPAGWSLPPHRHHNEAETIHIIDGLFELEVDGARTQLSAGQTLHIPRGVIHGGANIAATTGRRLLIFSPAGIEQFFLEAGATSAEHELDPLATLACAQRHGWEFLNSGA